jgi:hypothetical protein
MGMSRRKNASSVLKKKLINDFKCFIIRTRDDPFIIGRYIAAHYFLLMAFEFFNWRPTWMRPYFDKIII